MVKIQKLTKRFGSATAVHCLSLDIPPGELFAFIGPNGAGKTTTIKMIVGLLRPTDGDVWLCGHNIRDDHQAAQSVLSYVPDEPYIYDKLTGREFLEFVGRMYGLKHTTIQERIEVLAVDFGLSGFLDALGETYSHGMKQRVVISAALLHDPSVLVVDEPLVGLDPKGASVLKRVLRQRAQDGTTIFMSTHTLGLAEDIADRVGIISQGQLIALGRPSQILEMAKTDGRLEEAFLVLTREPPAPPSVEV